MQSLCFSLLLILRCLASGSITYNMTLYELVNRYSAETDFVKFINETGLASKLNSAGPFTVFAPINQAFSNLPRKVIEYYENSTQRLTELIEYHIVRGRYTIADLDANDMELASLSNQKIRINVYKTNQVVTAEGCSIIYADRIATNGVLHIVSDVLLYPENSIAGDLAKYTDFSIFLKMVKAVGMEKLLAEGLITVFAPDNSAIEKLGNSTINRLLNDIPLLKQIIQYHIVHGVLWYAGIHTTYVVTFHKNERLWISKSLFGTAFIGNARILGRDHQATNGVLHRIDHLLIPPDLKGHVIVG